MAGKGWVPPSKPGEQEWVWDYVSSVYVDYPTKWGHWVRACPSGAVEELHRDPDHDSGKPGRWAFQDCKGERGDRPFDKATFGDEWRDDRWWPAADDGSMEVGAHEAKEYLAYCMRAAPSLMALVTEAMEFDIGSFGVTVPYVVEDDGGWNTAGFPDGDGDHRDLLVPFLAGLLVGPSTSAVLTGPSLPTEVAEGQSGMEGVARGFSRDMGDHTEKHWTLLGSRSIPSVVRQAVRFTSSIVFDMGLLLDVDISESVRPGQKMGKDLPNVIAQHVTALYVHGPSYDGHLIWRRN